MATALGFLVTCALESLTELTPTATVSTGVTTALTSYGVFNLIRDNYNATKNSDNLSMSSIP